MNPTANTNLIAYMLYVGLPTLCLSFNGSWISKVGIWLTAFYGLKYIGYALTYWSGENT